MTWVSLQMISLASLLIFDNNNNSTSSFTAAAAPSPQCLSEDEMNSRAANFLRRYWDRYPRDDTRTCVEVAQAARGDVKTRSLSPWTYRLNQDVNRIPQNISFAECLSQGCIINQREDPSYNSVLVSAHLIVMNKSRCPHDQNKYVLTKILLKVPVGCTCVFPKVHQ